MIKNKHYSLTATSTLVPLLIVLWAFCLSPWFLPFEENLGLKWLFQWRGTLNAPDSVIVIGMDTESASEMGLPNNTSQWPRTVHARLIDELLQRGAAAIAFDIAFKQPRDPAQDKQFEKAVQQAENVVLFKYLQRPMHSVTDSQNQSIAILDIEIEIPPIQAFSDSAAAVAPFTLPKFPVSVLKTDLYKDLSGGIEATLPLTALMIAMRGVIPDLIELMKHRHAVTQNRDSSAYDKTPVQWETLKQQPQLLARYMYHQFRTNPQLADQLLEDADKLKAKEVSKQLRTLIYALNQISPIYINFYGPARTVTTVPYNEIISAKPDEQISYRGQQEEPGNTSDNLYGRSDDGLVIEQARQKTPLPDFNGKIVLVGLSEMQQTEQYDVYHTVFTLENGVDISGVEIGATVIANMLEQKLISPLSTLHAIILTTLWAIILYALLTALPVRTALLIQSLIVVGYLYFAYIQFATTYLWLPLATPLACLILINLAAISARYRHSRQIQARITDALSRYLPKEAAEALSQDLRQLQEQFHEVQGICLMTDIEGFTRIAEERSSHELHRIMNQYYEQLLQTVEPYGGKVANIVGDSLLLMWTGESIDQEMLNRACNAALAIKKKFSSYDGIDGILLPTSVGVHGGSFSVGNLGGINHFEYAPVGDIVNTTSRIEALNRNVGTRVLLTQTVAEKISGYCIRYLGHIPLKNKSEPVITYELLGLQSDITQSIKTLIDHFTHALHLYENSQFEAALEAFEGLLEFFPNDGPSHYYQQQCLIKTESIKEQKTPTAINNPDKL